MSTDDTPRLAVARILGHYWADEEKDYIAQGEPAGHIYEALRELDAWMDGNYKRAALKERVLDMVRSDRDAAADVLMEDAQLARLEYENAVGMWGDAEGRAAVTEGEDG
jgi:hypothetical protein